jgi:hypothetical protein
MSLFKYNLYMINMCASYPWNVVALVDTYSHSHRKKKVPVIPINYRHVMLSRELLLRVAFEYKWYMKKRKKKKSMSLMMRR